MVEDVPVEMAEWTRSYSARRPFSERWSARDVPARARPNASKYLEQFQLANQ